MNSYKRDIHTSGWLLFVLLSQLSLQNTSADPNLQSLIDTIWKKDGNGLTSYWDYNYDPQAKVYYTEKIESDYSRRPLFSGVSSAALKKTTFKAFIDLLDNYYPEVGRAEKVTNSETQENWLFINAVFLTSVMQEVYAYLKRQGKASTSSRTFRRELYDMWFGLYKRSRSFDSCGFEHVFVGEKREKVLGLHNWIQFYMLERKGLLNYVGFVGQRSDFPVLKVQFTWQGKVKPLGSIILGTSPEFEMALYTLVFKLEMPSVRFTLNGQLVDIKCFKMQGKIGTCYASPV